MDHSEQVKLFISDIDGCLSEPYAAFDLDGFQTLRKLVRASMSDPAIPAFSLCSGRSYAYVEAMTQAVEVRQPVLFESGGGWFDPVAVAVRWNPALTPDIEEQLRAVREWLVGTCLPGTTAMFDYGKRTQAGIVSSDTDEIDALVPQVEQFVAEHLPDLRVFHTPISIDVLAPEITKKQALHWLSRELDVPLQQMAYIGDTNGDLEALGDVGCSFAPANATPEVRAKVDHTTDGAVIQGVLDAYTQCIAHNRERIDRKAS
ncbi:MAG: HAD hydrolase family protein [Bacteroidetes bacterium]|nr:HAD hydrolase family protein [Bacteroidota bacterium]